MELNTVIEKKRILVVGDSMIDVYFNGSVNRISPEAPVPVFLKRDKERIVLGGAANVSANLVTANQNVSIMTVIGNDDNGRNFEQMINKIGIDSSLILKSSSRCTTVKTRFLAENNQQLLRLDIEDKKDISVVEEKLLIEMLENNIKSFDLIIISDYLKGLLTYSFIQKVIKMANYYKIKTIIDVKDPHIDKYVGAFLLKPNLKELNDLTKMSVETDDEIIEASKVLCEKCKCEYVLTTCGSRGMIFVDKKGIYNKVKCVPVDVYDVTGAGDTVIAYLGACMANDIDIIQSIFIANLAAGVQVSKVGTSTVYWNEIKQHMLEQTDERVNSYKIIEINAIEKLKRINSGKKIVFTNGCFDILHIGHIRYLKKASKLGEILIVGVNSDLSVKRLKGDERPINTEQDRIEVLAALDFVDYVILFDEDTPYKLIKEIRPDVLVKGADYKPEDVVGKDIVEENGGKLELISFVDGKSTTNLINKIRSFE